MTSKHGQSAIPGFAEVTKGDLRGAGVLFCMA